MDAIGYLHEKNIVHNDIKDENIIVTTELKVTIIDFGSASFDDGEKTRFNKINLIDLDSFFSGYTVEVRHTLALRCCLEQDFTEWVRRSGH